VCFASTPLRNALVLAYQWASLDFLSGGRTIFVACQGQPEPGGGAFEKEFAHFGIEPSSRMRRMEEAIEILRLTSSREDVDYDGQYWRFRNLTVLPRPIQQLRCVNSSAAFSTVAPFESSALATRRPAFSARPSAILSGSILMRLNWSGNASRSVINTLGGPRRRCWR
jgi:hypothetical protein